MANVGKQIKEFRIKKNMTQDELAEKLFVSRQTISNYENNKSRPDIEVLIQLAEIFETDVNTLVCGDEKNIEFRKRVKNYIIKIAILLFCIFFLVISHEAILQVLNLTRGSMRIFVELAEWLGLESHEADSIQIHICFWISVYNLYLIHPAFAVFSGYQVMEGLLLLQKKIMSNGNIQNACAKLLKVFLYFIVSLCCLDGFIIL